ncbi:O-antigen ligase family protein [Luteococcus sp. OSA5]|uniref:O-antigen ligase family protein n=1 Tax=Luteococcus sp. OSA5 TaxID=3401630 RepID=UPI003B438E5D
MSTIVQPGGGETPSTARHGGLAPTGPLRSPDPALGEDSADRSIPLYVWLYLAGLLFNMFSGNTWLLGLPLPLDRPLFLAALVLLALDPYRERWRWRPVYLIGLLTVLVTCYSWFSTGEATDSYKLYMLVDRIVMPLLMFAAGPMVFATRARRMLLLKFMTLLTIYWGITAIGEIAHQDWLVFPRFIMNPDVGIGYGRARGPFLASEPMGMACALGFFTSGLLASMTTGRWRRLALAAMAFGFIGDALAMTRTLWLALLAGVLVIGVLVPALRRRLPMMIMGSVGSAAVALLAIPGLLPLLVERLTTSRSIYDRVLTNDAAMRIIEAKPFTGVGWGNFVGVNVDWVRQADTIPLTTVTIEVHNVLLARAAETGIQGAVLWALCMLLGPAAVLVSRTPTPEAKGWQLVTIGALFVWLLPTLGSPNPYPFPNNMIWLIGGIASRHLLIAPARRIPLLPARQETP